MQKILACVDLVANGIASVLFSSWDDDALGLLSCGDSFRLATPRTVQGCLVSV